MGEYFASTNSGGVPARAGWWLLLAIALFSAWTGMAPRSSAPPPPVVMADGVHQGDQALYRQINAAVAAGEPYYRAAARLHRQHGYPLHPFVTVRPPTLAWLSALVGPIGLWALAISLVGGNAVAWYVRLRRHGPVLRLGGLALLSAWGAAGLSPQVLTAHEWWAGLLLSLALSCRWDRAFGPMLACAIAAALLRELAASFLLAMLAHALLTRSRTRALALLAALACLALLLIAHWLAVRTVVLPTDLASPGWLGLRGPAGFARDFLVLADLTGLPPALGTFLALSPLAGWLLAHRQLGLLPFTWFAAFVLGEGLLARPDTYYWVQLVFPSYVLGWLFAAVNLLRVHQSADRIEAASPSG